MMTPEMLMWFELKKFIREEKTNYGKNQLLDKMAEIETETAELQSQTVFSIEGEEEIEEIRERIKQSRPEVIRVKAGTERYPGEE